MYYFTTEKLLFFMWKDWCEIGLTVIEHLHMWSKRIFTYVFNLNINRHTKVSQTFKNIWKRREKIIPIVICKNRHDNWVGLHSTWSACPVSSCELWIYICLSLFNPCRWGNLCHDQVLESRVEWFSTFCYFQNLTYCSRPDIFSEVLVKKT